MPRKYSVKKGGKRSRQNGGFQWLTNVAEAAAGLKQTAETGMDSVGAAMKNATVAAGDGAKRAADEVNRRGKSIVPEGNRRGNYAMDEVNRRGNYAATEARAAAANVAAAPGRMHAASIAHLKDDGNAAFLARYGASEQDLEAAYNKSKTSDATPDDIEKGEKYLALLKDRANMEIMKNTPQLGGGRRTRRSRGGRRTRRRSRGGSGKGNGQPHKADGLSSSSNSPVGTYLDMINFESQTGGRRKHHKKGQKSRTMKDKKDFTTKKGNMFFNRRGHRQRRPRRSKKIRLPYEGGRRIRGGGCGCAAGGLPFFYFI